MTHADIADSPGKLTSLCGKKGGYYVWADRHEVAVHGLPAGVDCGWCQRVAELLRFHSLTKARKLAKEEQEGW